jgi:phage replication initiation protein
MMKIDWIQCTVKGVTASVLSALREYFRVDWQDNDFGGMGYDASATVWECGRVFWSTVRPDMGVHVRLPPSSLASAGVDPVTVLCDFYAMGAQFTRVDIAMDDRQGLLDLKEIARKTEDKCEIVCLAHAGIRHKGTFGKTKDGHTETYGSRQSETFVRIYDKAAEQMAKTGEAVSHWIRVEFEYKGARAQAAAEYIAAQRDAWQETARGWFLAYLDFKEPGEDANKSRWKSCDWWLNFLEYASKVRLLIMRVTKTVDDVKHWVNKQVAPSLFVLSMTIGHDDLFHMVGEASARLSRKHVNMIQSYGQMPLAMTQAGA